LSNALPTVWLRRPSRIVITRHEAVDRSARRGTRIAEIHADISASSRFWGEEDTVMLAHPWLLSSAFVAAVLAVGALGLVISRRCTHRYATLLPPVRSAGPDRDHARWYCDRCGRTWDADFESTTHPRVIYEGHDEQQAMHAAIRADAFDKRRRQLASQRGDAGSKRRRISKPATVTRIGPKPIEHVLEQRAVGTNDARPFVAARRARD
jgi:hypothetical protein